MVKQTCQSSGSRLSAAKLHRHQRVQKMLANRRSCRSRSEYSSSDDVSSLSDDVSTSSVDIFVSKQQQRKLRNRQSAAASRLKKKSDMEALQSQITSLEQENSILRSLLLEKHPNILSQLLDMQRKVPDGAFSPDIGLATQVLNPSAVSNSNELAVHV